MKLRKMCHRQTRDAERTTDHVCRERKKAGDVAGDVVRYCLIVGFHGKVVRYRLRRPQATTSSCWDIDGPMCIKGNL